MYSSDNTINDPNHKEILNPYEALNLSNHIEVLSVTQEQYDLMAYHDPQVVYIIYDSRRGDMYIGDNLIPRPQNKNQYLLALGDHRKSFIIYLNAVTGYLDDLIPVAEFSDINAAIAALYQYKKVGTHINLGHVVCSIVECYMNGEYGINEALINIIAESGFRDDIRLQYLNEKAISYGVSNKDKNLPQYYIAALHNLKDKDPNAIISIYSDLYDVFVKYNFMEDITEDNIHEVVSDLMTAMHSYVF